MMITEPNKSVAEVHDRMPALLAEKDYEPWLKAALAGPEIYQACRRECAAKVARFKAQHRSADTGR